MWLSGGMHGGVVDLCMQGLTQCMPASTPLHAQAEAPLLRGFCDQCVARLIYHTFVRSNLKTVVCLECLIRPPCLLGTDNRGKAPACPSGK